MGAGKLGHKHIRVLDTEGIGAVAAYAHRAEIGIAEHDGICRTPTLFGEAIGADKIYLRFEGRFETVFPGQKSGENGKAVGVQLVIARKKDVGHAALVANTAAWPSRTVSAEPRAITFFLVSILYTKVLCELSDHSITLRSAIFFLRTIDCYDNIILCFLSGVNFIKIIF